MDLTADLLFDEFRRVRPPVVEVELIRPPFRQWFTAPGWHARHLWNLDRGLNRYWHYPATVARMAGRFDVFHIVDHSYAHLVHALPAERTLVTCHDADIFHCLFQGGRRATNALLRTIASRVLSGMRKAAAIACDSRQTREQLISLGIADASKLIVIPIGVHRAFKSTPDAIADHKVTLILGPENPPRADILHVGSTIERKRITFLLRFFAEVVRTNANIRLLRVGGPFTAEQAKLAEELGIADRVMTLPFLGRTELAAVYRRAAVTVLPSASEGFGLPVTESLACGTPVLLSDLPALHEVGGDAATFCPLDDIGAWVRAFSALVHESAKKRAARRKAAVIWALRFSPENYAKQTAELYARLLGMNCPPIERSAEIELHASNV
jgi:glycosyltransferase involved in cell wall biosynthesis